MTVVDLYKGVMKCGALKMMAQSAATAKMMRIGFLYSTNNLHKYLELYELCCCSSIFVCEISGQK